MTITPRVQSQYFVDGQELIRLPPSEDQPNTNTRRAGRPWTADEHDRFLEALEMFPSGPWKVIAAHIGTRTTRQTMTHAQKYREKIARRRRIDDGPSADVDLQMEAAPTQSTGAANSTNAPLGFESGGVDDTPYIDSKFAIDDAVIALLESYEPLELTDDMLAGIELELTR
jgi:SHAQKYF class myb-like DNA-binding protein